MSAAYISSRELGSSIQLLWVPGLRPGTLHDVADKLKLTEGQGFEPWDPLLAGQRISSALD